MFNLRRWTKRVVLVRLAECAVLLAGVYLAGAAAGAVLAVATAPGLGTAGVFAVLGGSTVTNTGPTTISGSLGVSPGTAVVGFPSGTVTGGTIHAADAVALQAQNDALTAYNNLASQPCDFYLTGQDLGGKTLVPGVYCFTSSAQLTGDLTLNFLGNSNAVFVFKIGSTLTTASNASVSIINGGSICNVFWQVGSSATLGTTTSFVGNILALASVTLNTGATVDGRVFARTGAVTMDTNNISNSACNIAPPVQGQPDIQISKSDGGLSTTPNGTIMYTLTYTNAGNVAVSNVTITETVPAATTFNAADTLPFVWICDGVTPGSTCTANVGTVQPGMSGSVRFAVTVDYPVGVTEIVNTVTIADDHTHGADIDTGNNTDDEQTPIIDAPNPRISKSSGLYVAPGGIITWTLYFTNTGTVTATSVVLTETVPNNTRYAAAASSPFVWSCADGSVAGTICTLNVGDLPPLGGAGSAIFAVQVDNPLLASVITINNTVRLGDASATSIVITQQHTEFIKAAWHDPVTPGWSSQRYNIVVHNTGVAAMTNVVITDIIPLGTRYLESTIPVTSSTPPDMGPVWFAPGGVWDGDRTVTWDVGDLPPGWYAMVKVRVRVQSYVAPGSFLVNTALLGASSGQTMTVTQSTRVIAFPVAATPTPTATATPPVGDLCLAEAIIRLDAGSPVTYTDTSGDPWLPDQQYIAGVNTWGYSGGAFTYTTNSPINGALDPALYQTERWWVDAGSYRFAVANGYYRVVFKFAEIYPYAFTASRVFNVRVENATAIAHLDVFAASGRYNAYDRTVDTVVSDGALNLEFAPEKGAPAVKAIAIFALQPCATTPTPTPTETPPALPTVTASPTPTPASQTFALALNAGGPAYTDATDQLWQADQPYTAGGWGHLGGFTYGNPAAIGGTSDDVLYQAERWWNGAGSYRFTLDNGVYNVTLRFAEIYPYSYGGSRVFDISINGQLLQPKVDIARAVGLYNAYDLTFSGIQVATGMLQIDLIPKNGAPKINAILIVAP